MENNRPRAANCQRCVQSDMNLTRSVQFPAAQEREARVSEGGGRWRTRPEPPKAQDQSGCEICVGRPERTIVRLEYGRSVTGPQVSSLFV